MVYIKMVYIMVGKSTIISLIILLGKSTIMVGWIMSRFLVLKVFLIFLDLEFEAETDLESACLKSRILKNQSVIVC